MLLTLLLFLLFEHVPAIGHVSILAWHVSRDQVTMFHVFVTIMIDSYDCDHVLGHDSAPSAHITQMKTFYRITHI